jgi:hypothetical protein
MQTRYFLEAEYDDGYVHSELKLGDKSPYVQDSNIFGDILHKRPVQEHGKMVRYSFVGPERRFDVDWSNFPDNAKPIRFIHKQLEQDQHISVSKDGYARSWENYGDPRVKVVSYDFGYEYFDKDGKKHKEIKEIM